MLRFLPHLFMCFCLVGNILSVNQAFAQNFLINGKVLDMQGDALIGANIMLKGTSIGTISDSNGDFSLQAKSGDVLIISFLGFHSREVLVSSATSLSIQLEEDQNYLAEVVVVGALGVERSSREMGGSAQVVNNEQLNQGKTINPILGLTSKVAGLRINMYDSKVDPQVQITMRGTRSMSRTAGIDGRGSNEPLYVVDGVPLPTIGRLNPNDIASITVLKGANAAALYGSEGVNGAIMITTKKGNSQRGEIRFSNTTTFSNVYLLPPAQREYGQGNNGIYDPVQYESWGPKFDGSMKDFGLPLPNGEQPQLKYAAPSKDNRLDLFKTGVNVQNDLSFSGGDKNSTYFLSAQDVRIKGIIPGDESSRSGFRFNGSRKFGKLNTSYNFNYVAFKKNTTPDGPWVGAYRYPANFDFDMVKDWKDPLSPGNPLNYFTSQGSWLRNPYFLIGSIRDEVSQNTINGKVELDYEVTPWMKAIYRLGLYNLAEDARSSTRKFEGPGTRNTNGSVTDATTSYNRINSDFMLIFNKKFDKISTRLLVGQNVRMDDKKAVSVGATNLLYPDVFNPGSRTGELTGGTTITQYRSMAAYGELTVGYNNYLFVSLTGRNDWVSVLNPENRSYFYPGVSTSVMLNEAINVLKKSDNISYFKVYSSYNKTGNVTLLPYQLNNSYSQINGFPYGNVVGFVPSSTSPNPNIQPEFVRSFEIGTQLGFWNNRLNVEFNYIHSDSRGQIFNATTSRVTGYSSARVNAGKLTNDIREFVINGDVISNNTVNWNIGFNVAYTNNRVEELYEGLTSINNFRQSYAVIGQKYPTLLVSDYKRDSEGRVVVDATTGDPIVASESTTLGTLIPPYQMGISSVLSFKGFTLSAQFDWRKGGWMYSEIIPAMYAAGTHPATVEYGREPFVYPNSVIETSPGVFTPNTELKTSDGGRAFWSKQGEVQINTAAKSDFFKLRELSLVYTIPTHVLGIDNIIRSATIGFVGTNLFIIRDKDNQIGDPEYLYNNTDGYSSFRQVPPYRTYGFTLNVTL
jgi:TonB-linked SusC/RagA family outer membrane protein